MSSTSRSAKPGGRDSPRPSAAPREPRSPPISSLFDSHCHLAFNAFDADRGEVVARARSAGVAGCLLVAVDADTARAAKLLAAALPGWGYPTAGIHPTEKAVTHEPAWREVEVLLEEGGFVAVGETGLDAYHTITSLDDQSRSMHRHIRTALDHDLPVILHCRKAFTRLSMELAVWRGAPLRGVLHCFTGDQSDVASVIEAGLHIGVGGAATFPANEDLRNAVKTVPIDRLLLETDAPWLAPVPVRGRRNEPAFVAHVAKRLAHDRGISYESLANATTENALVLFSIGTVRATEIPLENPDSLT